MTKRQRQVLRKLGRMIDRNGYVPTIRELADELGITSPNGMMCHLRALRDQGEIDWVDGKARTLRVLEGV